MAPGLAQEPFFYLSFFWIAPSLGANQNVTPIAAIKTRKGATKIIKLFKDCHLLCIIF